MNRTAFSRLTTTLLLGGTLLIAIVVINQLPRPVSITPLASPLLQECHPPSSGNDVIIMPSPTGTWEIPAPVATLPVARGTIVPPTELPAESTLPPQQNSVIVAVTPDTVLPSATPLLNQGIHLTALSKVDTAQTDIEYERLFNPAADANKLVAVARAKTTGTFVVVIDPDTGQARRVSNVNTEGISQLHIAGRFIAWTELNQSTSQEELNVYDLALGCVGKPDINIQVRNGYDLKGNLIVWSGYTRGFWSINGHDLSAQTTFTVTDGKAFSGYPRICSADWMAYLDHIEPSVQGDIYGRADLYAYNLNTRERIHIGSIPFPNTANTGEQFACDSHWVAWISGGDLTGTKRQPLIQNVFDLDTRTNRVLNVGVPYLPSLQLSNGILRSSTFYDLINNTSFSADLSIADARAAGAYSLLSKDKYLILVNIPNTMPTIYMATIVRGNATTQ